MADLLSADVVSKLVGVIDLKQGQAVHAIAGLRKKYKPVAFCGGDPLDLVDFYIRCGLSAIYIADLDSIGGSVVQTDMINALCRRIGDRRILLDVGWTGVTTSQTANNWSSVVVDLERNWPTIQWIAATESMNAVTALQKFAALVPVERLLLGFDFHEERLLGKIRFDEWMDIGLRTGIAGAVILDLATVGSNSGPSTTHCCEMVQNLAPHWTIYSGGGIRDARDVDALLAAGCDRCLVATAIHGILEL